MRDPFEGLSEAGIIQTGADLNRVSVAFQPAHDAAIALILESAEQASVYAYGSVVTGQAVVGVSDVDLLVIGLGQSAAEAISQKLSTQFADLCRSVDVGAAAEGDFVGERDEAYGNRIFLRHYCVLLAGPDVHRPSEDFAGDRRAARSFNGDIGQHAQRWREALESGHELPGAIARRAARKSLLAVAGLVSVSDQTWTTDRETAAVRWGEIAVERQAGLAELLSWTSTEPDVSAETVHQVLDGTIAAIVTAFREQIGLWPQ